MADSLDRTKLSIPDPPFRGVAHRTLKGSEPDWNIIGHVTPPDGAPNSLLVRIDDAGYGQHEHVRRRRRHAQLQAPKVVFDMAPHLDPADGQALHSRARALTTLAPGSSWV